MGELSPGKAKRILKDKEVRGKPLTKKARGFMGMIASGKEPTRVGTPTKKGKVDY